MKNDMSDLKKLVREIMQKGTSNGDVESDNEQIIKNLYGKVQEVEHRQEEVFDGTIQSHVTARPVDHIQDTEEISEESLSLEDKEIELIQKALEKHRGKRKYAAQELGISERTLYRKIKEHNIE